MNTICWDTQTTKLTGTWSNQFKKLIIWTMQEALRTMNFNTRLCRLEQAWLIVSSRQRGYGQGKKLHKRKSENELRLPSYCKTA